LAITGIETKSTCQNLTLSSLRGAIDPSPPYGSAPDATLAEASCSNHNWLHKAVICMWHSSSAHVIITVLTTGMSGN